MNNTVCDFLANHYQHTLDSLENISKDNDGNELTNSSKQAYNLDTIIGESFCSCDAIIAKQDIIYLLEFKNINAINNDSQRNKYNQYWIKLKVLDSLISLGNIMKKKKYISKFSELYKARISVIIVYSYDKTHAQANARLRARLQSYSFFDLCKYEGIIFYQTFTVHDELFNTAFEPQL